MPTCCFLSAWRKPFRHFFFIPVVSVATGIILTLVSQEVDAWYDYLSQKGIAFETPPQFNPKFNIYHCFLRDPNGYLIEIQRFEDPAWPRK